MQTKEAWEGGEEPIALQLAIKSLACNLGLCKDVRSSTSALPIMLVELTPVFKREPLRVLYNG